MIMTHLFIAQCVLTFAMASCVKHLGINVKPLVMVVRSVSERVLFRATYIKSGSSGVVLTHFYCGQGFRTKFSTDSNKLCQIILVCELYVRVIEYSYVVGEKLKK